MLVTFIITTLIVAYAAFVVYRLVKKYHNAKKNGGACCGCSAGCCPNCNK